VVLDYLLLLVVPQYFMLAVAGVLEIQEPPELVAQAVVETEP
jgi:hypothetical protein